MAENIEDRKDDFLFLQLVLTFQNAAWQQLGKIKNPITDKVERDLGQARFSIDILQMLRSRTEGNLQPNEKQFLDKVISELQLNYIDEMSKEIKEKEEEKETEKSEKQEKIQEKKKSSKKPVEKVTSGKSQGKKPRGDLKRGTKK
jgi:hypothetical protein